MNEQDIKHALRDAAHAEPMPAFSPALHERTMERVRREVSAGTSRNPGRYRIGIAASVAVAAGLAIMVGGVVWRGANQGDAARPAQQEVLATLGVPSDVVTSGALAAQKRIDQMMATSDVASLDQDAIRLTRFVVGQLQAVRLPTDAGKEADQPKRL